ncbi:hypothetical protein MMC09_002957 [Bachmanniomyces sp. S44760]|nr:hypothetical protein [Bachmanniomyces sp. S44760]
MTRHESLSSLISSARPDLQRYETLYKHFHSHPELSFLEHQTTATVADHLRSLEPKYEIHEKVGRTGVVAILKHGPGKTVLLRADMDALPIKEATGLPYASTVTMKDLDGVEHPVMHACGHDHHITGLLCAAETLATLASKDKWSGTLVLVFQPAEEIGRGAQAMVDDGLYDLLPSLPDVVLGQHVMPFRSGDLGSRVGATMAAADSFHITMHGRGGHASMPDKTIDPVLMGCSTVCRLQSIVSRELDPNDMAVLTVGAIQAGKTENVISNKAELRVNVRTVNEGTRERVLSGMKRIVRAESEASGAPQEPDIEETTRFPITENDADITRKLAAGFEDVFGDRYNADIPRVNGSEDFSILATSRGIPYCFWFYGGIDPERMMSDDTHVPVNHSPFFAPVIEPTLRTGADALTTAAMTMFRSE